MMTKLKFLEKVTCGLGKSSSGKDSDSPGKLGRKRQKDKEKGKETLDIEPVQQPSTRHGCLAPANKSSETELALPPRDAVKQNASDSLLPEGPTVPSGNMSREHSGMGTSQSKHKDLWDEAYTKLREENPDLFKKYTCCVMIIEDNQEPGMTHDIDQLESDRRERYLATLIEKRVEKIKEEEWPTATMVYKNTVGMVLFAKDFITQVASNEPHAALAWAGVSMLLPVSGRFS